MAESRRKYAHINWQSLRELIGKGATLRELSKAFDIPINTLQSRAYRERWGVMAIRSNLPKRSTTDRKDQQREQTLTNTLRNGVVLPLVKLASYYQACDLPTLRKNQTQFLAFANAALKALTANDGRSAASNRPIVNLVLAQTHPQELIVRASREGESVRVLDSQSSEKSDVHEGNPVADPAESARSATSQPLESP